MKLRRFVIFAMLVICVFSMVPQVSAVEVKADSNFADLIINEQYGYEIAEYTDLDKRVVRKYVKDENTKSGILQFIFGIFSDEITVDLYEIRSILSDLGLAEDFIKELSYDELMSYAQCEEITSVSMNIEGNVQGVQTDKSAEGSVSTYALPDFSYTGPEDGGTAIRYSQEKSRYDIDFTLIVLDFGGGKYRFSLNAVYNEMPDQRYWDGFGIAAQGFTYDGNAKAWYIYDQVRTNRYTGEAIKTYEDVETDLESGIVTDSAANCWGAKGLRFTLPEDYYDGVQFIQYTNLRVHLEYEAVVTYPNEEMNFQVHASYEHMKYEIEYIPSFGFDTDGGVSYSFSFDVEEETDVYSFCFENALKYVPD